MFPGFVVWDRKGLLAALALALFAPSSRGAAVDFNRDVRPIFSEHCYACHGPDEGKRKAGLRLDREEEAFKELKSGGRAIVAGGFGKGGLVEGITTSEEGEKQPPIKNGAPHSAGENTTTTHGGEGGAR